MSQDLQEIISATMNGDHAAFRKLVTMYQQPAYRLAFRILGNEDEARDAVQETFIKIWQKIGSFDTSREFAPWMFRILANTATDRQRAILRHPMVPMDGVMQKIEYMQQHDQATPAENRELAILISRIADTLPVKQRLVFLLRDMEGMASAEVELITDLDENAVKSNLYHARKKVREKLVQLFEKERNIV
jgi:RNA polymerase sigma-70 factor (ECF subfamily)